MVLCLSMLPTPTHKCVYTLPITIADSVAMETGCLYSLDWTTGLDHWTGPLHWITGHNFMQKSIYDVIINIVYHLVLQSELCVWNVSVSVQMETFQIICRTVGQGLV